MSEDTISRTETVVEEDCAHQSSSSSPIVTKKCFRTDTITPNKVISSLEKFILDSKLDKSYKKVATDGISSSKRTLESLLARNGGQQNQKSDSSLNEFKNYTLDANGRVCLVKSPTQQTSRHKELRLLQQDTHELRCLQEYLILALESIMQKHRQMMACYVKNVNQHPKKVCAEEVQKTMKSTDAQMVHNFAKMASSVDYTLEKEEIRSENRKKIMEHLDMETFLMKALLEMEDIREANVENLINTWRKRQNVVVDSTSMSNDTKDAN